MGYLKRPKLSGLPRFGPPVQTVPLDHGVGVG